MKASRFTDAQKAFILKQGEDGVPIAEVCRKAGISHATFFNWRKKFASATSWFASARGISPAGPLVSLARLTQYGAHEFDGSAR